MKKYYQIFTNKKFMLLMVVLGCEFAGFICWITAGPLLVIESLHYSKIAFGLMQAAVFGSYMIGNHIIDKLLETREADGLVNLGLMIALVCGLAALAFTVWLPQQFYLFLLAIICYSFGSALCFAPLNRLIIEASDQPMGSRVAMFTTGLMLAGVTGSGVASIIYDGTSYSLAIILAVGITVGCVLKALDYFATKTTL